MAGARRTPSACSALPSHSTGLRLVAFILCVFGLAMWATGPSQKGWAADQGQMLAEVRTVVKKLQARYRKTKDLQADFAQSTRIEGFATPLTSSGRVYIKKPGKLRWDYREPSVEEIYVDEDTVNIYVPEHQQVLVGDLTKMTASRAPLQLLQGMANLEEQFTVVPTDGAARGAGGLALVTLLPKPGEQGSDQNMRKIVLEVQPKTYFLKTVSIHDITGNVSTFAFSNLRPNTGLSDNVFRFRVPPGVEVVKAPELGGP